VRRLPPGRIRRSSLSLTPAVWSVVLWRTVRVLPMLGLLPLVTRIAGADVAPPSGYVEQCILQNAVTDTSECLRCGAIRLGYTNSDRCTLLLSPYCYVPVCGAWGGVSYPEIWCRTKGPEAPAVPAEIQTQFTGFSAAVVAVSDGDGAAGAPNCLPYSPPTIGGQGNPTSPPTIGGRSNSIKGGGCTIARGQLTSRSSGWMSCALLIMGFGAIRRWRGRCPRR
jgi:hypothetical protein